MRILENIKSIILTIFFVSIIISNVFGNEIKYGKYILCYSGLFTFLYILYFSSAGIYKYFFEYDDGIVVEKVKVDNVGFSFEYNLKVKYLDGNKVISVIHNSFPSPSINEKVKIKDLQNNDSISVVTKKELIFYVIIVITIIHTIVYYIMETSNELFFFIPR